jgi:hypothetical protein
VYKYLLPAVTVLLWPTLFVNPGFGASGAPCLVTLPPSPAFIPPGPYQSSPDENGFWFGDRELWVRLPIELTARQGDKLFVWSTEYKDPARESKPALVVTGRRLDGESRPFVAQNATNVLSLRGGPAMLIGITVPEAGCWELTAFYRSATVSFVVSVNR